MTPLPPIPPAAFLAALKAAGEETRLRILALLGRGDMTVSDLQAVLDQSQPRISRHLRLLAQAGLISRSRDGAWSFYGLTPEASVWLPGLARLGDDPDLGADAERLAALRETHAREAALFFARNAADWDRIRALHAPDETVEGAMLELAGSDRVERLLDVGTGTGRMLEVFAPLYREGLGIDTSSEMLAIARAKLHASGASGARVLRADLFDPDAAPGPFSFAVVHQVLHFLDRPGDAVAETVRCLAPGGRILVADFAPHDHEFLAREQSHRRLGFERETVERWLVAAGATPVAGWAIEPLHGDGLTVLLWLARRDG